MSRECYQLPEIRDLALGHFKNIELEEVYLIVRAVTYGSGVILEAIDQVASQLAVFEGYWILDIIQFHENCQLTRFCSPKLAELRDRPFSHSSSSIGLQSKSTDKAPAKLDAV